MYNKLYDNCFKTELNTKVIKIEEEKGLYWHACKDTIFFPGNDEMENDLGKIDNHTVIKLRVKDGYVWHLLDVKLEGSVFMSVNLHERFRRCQTHTARHLITTIFSNVHKSKLLRYETHDDGNVLEFDFCDFTDKKLSELQVLCNGLIRDDLDVSILYPTPAEASRYLPQSMVMVDDLRVVRIGALDYIPCNALHVPSLRYLQMLYFQGWEKTDNGVKITYFVGDQFLDSTSKRYEVLNELSDALGTPYLYLDSALQRMTNQMHYLYQEITEWKTRYHEMIVKELSARDEEIIVEFMDNVGRKGAINIAKKVCQDAHKAVILVAKRYDNVCVVICKHSKMEFDHLGIFKDIADMYHLKGGQELNLVYGEGLYKKSILCYAREMIEA